jgi:hypothetical protein
MTDEDLVKNLAWYREEAGLESAYPVTHPMSMFVRAIAARERLKKREWVELTEDEMVSLRSRVQEYTPLDSVKYGEAIQRAMTQALKEKNT